MGLGLTPGKTLGKVGPVEIQLAAGALAGACRGGNRREDRERDADSMQGRSGAEMRPHSSLSAARGLQNRPATDSTIAPVACLPLAANIPAGGLKSPRRRRGRRIRRMRCTQPCRAPSGARQGGSTLPGKILRLKGLAALGLGRCHRTGRLGADSRTRRGLPAWESAIIRQP